MALTKSAYSALVTSVRSIANDPTDASCAGHWLYIQRRYAGLCDFNASVMGGTSERPIRNAPADSATSSGPTWSPVPFEFALLAFAFVLTFVFVFAFAFAFVFAFVFAFAFVLT